MHGGPHPWPCRARSAARSIVRACIARGRGSASVLRNETTQAGGLFALVRTEGVRFRMVKASSSLVGAMTSGAGCLQTFRGTDSVWDAPTQLRYARMAGGRGAGGCDGVARDGCRPHPRVTCDAGAGFSMNPRPRSVLRCRGRRRAKARIPAEIASPAGPAPAPPPHHRPA